MTTDAPVNNASDDCPDVAAAPKLAKTATQPLRLEVRPSSLGEETGSGLFTLDAVPAGHTVCEYRGTLLRTRDASGLANKAYLMRLGPQSYVDAAEHPEVLARYINDCRNPAVYNVRFEKLPEEGRALVVSCRHICAGEELFVDYGKWYWALHIPRRISAADAAKVLLALEQVTSTAA